MKQKIYRIAERTSFGDSAGVDKENFVRILDGVEVGTLFLFFYVNRSFIFANRINKLLCF